jgi:beta-glucosidase
MPDRRTVLKGALAAGVLTALPSVTGLPRLGGLLPEAAADTTPPWLNPRLDPSVRAAALLKASTLDQKLRWLNELAANTPTETSFNSALGSGTITYPAQVSGTPLMADTDGPFGLRGPTGVTSFPAPIAQAASFDLSTSYRKGQAVAAEGTGKQLNVVLAPGISSARTPLHGRNSEFFSEDQVLSGLMAAANIRGLQEGTDTPVVSVLKHWVGNEQETDRQLSNSIIDDRTLHEIYTLPFEIAIKTCAPAALMGAYNQVNGTYCCENPELLTEILRTEIRFHGWVVTDYAATHSLTANPPSLVAGLDQELNAPRFWTPDGFHAALAAGTITEADIDRAAYRVVHATIAVGLFDHLLPVTATATVSTPDHQAIALDLAIKGSVLLKNTPGTLPLTGSKQKIAVIGPTASATPTEGISAQTVTSASFFGSPFVNCPNPAAALDAITTRAAESGSAVTFDNGGDPASAATTAAAADVAIVFGYYIEGEFADRSNLHLDGGGDALIEAVAAANPNTIVVLQTGGPVVMPWLDNVRAIMQNWYGGVNHGPAIAKLLFGDVNFSGKLPQTFPKSEADLPTAGSPSQFPGIFSDGSTTRPPGSAEIRQVHFSEGLKVGYRWYASQGIQPLFPFGFGLSYAAYSYSNLVVTSTGREMYLRFRLTNTSQVSGTETPQVYIELPAPIGEPSKRLAAWTQVTLRPGETRGVEIVLTADVISDQHLLDYWDGGRRQWATAPGTYTVHVGSSLNTELQASFHLGGWRS